METGRLARYKKTPVNSVLIWSSSTKAASCSPRTSERPGPPSVSRDFFPSVWPNVFNSGIRIHLWNAKQLKLRKSSPMLSKRGSVLQSLGSCSNF